MMPKVRSKNRKIPNEDKVLHRPAEGVSEMDLHSSDSATLQTQVEDLKAQIRLDKERFYRDYHLMVDMLEKALEKPIDRRRSVKHSPKIRSPLRELVMDIVNNVSGNLCSPRAPHARRTCACRR